MELLNRLLQNGTPQSTKDCWKSRKLSKCFSYLIIGLYFLHVRRVLKRKDFLKILFLSQQSYFLQIVWHELFVHFTLISSYRKLIPAV